MSFQKTRLSFVSSSQVEQIILQSVDEGLRLLVKEADIDQSGDLNFDEVIYLVQFYNPLKPEFSQ